MPGPADLLRLASLTGSVIRSVGKPPLLYQPDAIPDAQHPGPIGTVDLHPPDQALSGVLHQAEGDMPLLFLPQEQSVAGEHDPIRFPDPRFWRPSGANDAGYTSMSQSIQPS